MDDEIYVLAEKVGKLAGGQKKVLVTAESCTGGWVAQAITDVPGSSGWFERSFVTYSNKAKHEMLSISGRILLEFGAVSRQTVEAMADGALKNSTGDIAVAVSGIAGPGGGTRMKPVGTVWFAWATRDGELESKMEKLKGNRREVRAQSVLVALQGICDLLEKNTGQ